MSVAHSSREDSSARSVALIDADVLDLKHALAELKREVRQGADCRVVDIDTQSCGGVTGVFQQELRHVKEAVISEVGAARDQCMASYDFHSGNILKKLAGVEAMAQTLIVQSERSKGLQCQSGTTFNEDCDVSGRSPNAVKFESASCLVLDEDIKEAEKAEVPQQREEKCPPIDHYGDDQSGSQQSPDDPISMSKLRTGADSKGRFHSKLEPILVSIPYEIGMSVVIIVNSMCLGLQVEWASKGLKMPPVLDILENLILVIFIIEIALLLVVRGWAVFHNFSFIFDASLVLIGIIYLWIMKPFLEEEGNLEVLVVFRSFRVLRVTRVLRKLPFMRSSWQLVSGLLASASSMFSTIAVLIVINYSFACLGMELITCSTFLRSRPETALVIEERFSGVYEAMITLFQFVTVDDVNSVYAPLIKANPWLIFYFLPLLTIVSISVMNVVTSMIVEAAMGRSEEARQEQLLIAKKTVIKHEDTLFQELFAVLCKADKSCIVKKEFAAIPYKMLPTVLQTCITHFHFESMGEVFDVLDANENGFLGEEEFVKGMLRLRIAQLSNVPAEILLVLMHLRMLQKKTSDIAKAQDSWRR